MVYCFYKITLSFLLVYRYNKAEVFNQSECAYYLSIFINTYNIRYLPYYYKTLIDLSKINTESLVDLNILRDPAKILTLFYSLYSEHRTNLTV